MKKFILIFCLVFIFSLLNISCGSPYYKYKGKYVDLYTVAANSIPCNSGNISGADFNYDPQITIIEQDRYGRVLFAYPEDSVKGFVSLIIMQASLNNDVYFYEDINYICMETPVRLNKPYNINFSSETIEELKRLNDWDRELDLTQCKAVPISNEKKHILRESTDIDELLFSGKWCYIYHQTEDNYGRILACVTDGKEYYIVIFTPDFSYDINTSVLIPENILNCQEEIRQFKAQNHWNEEL